MFCNLTKISNPAGIDYCHFNLELTIDDTIMSIVNMLLKIATYYMALNTSSWNFSVFSMPN